MSYIDESLIEGETIIHRARVSWWSQFGYVLLGILLLAALLHLLSQQAGCATHTSGGSSFPDATGFPQIL